MKKMLIISMCLVFLFVVLLNTNGSIVNAQSYSLTEDQEVELIALQPMKKLLQQEVGKRNWQHKLFAMGGHG